MIFKSFLLEKDLTLIDNYRLILFYGENIGLKDDELYSNIRVTLGSINNKSEIDKFLELIQICIDKF